MRNSTLRLTAAKSLEDEGGLEATSSFALSLIVLLALPCGDMSRNTAQGQCQALFATAVHIVVT